jgi:hypothetical protein
MPTYIIGRDQSITAPGIVNDDVKKVALKASGTEHDVTVFGASALTAISTMIGLVDVSIEVTAMNTTAEIGDTGEISVGNFEPTGAEAVVTDVKWSVTPKGVKEYTVSYAIHPAPAP